MRIRNVCVLAFIIFGFMAGDRCPAGQISLKDKDGVYGANGIVYMFNSQSARNACRDEIQKSGGRGVICSDLSIPIEAGTKAQNKTISGDLRYVIIMDGPHQGQSGFIGINNYLDID